MTGSLLIYGATGYTGRLTAHLASARGLRPVLAGRDAAKVRPLAEDLGFEHRVFALDDPGAVDAGIAGMAAVLHMAGPFSGTFRPMAASCLRCGVHYLDITGEIDVFEALASLDSEARERGVMLLPGVGFDVVPSDCLAASVAARVPGARKLTIAIAGLSFGAASRGTAKSVMESIDRGTRVRRGGRIVALPAGSLAREIDFGEGPRPALAVGWGDVSTAWHSTGIAQVEVYFEEAGPLRALARTSRYLGWLLATAPAQRILKARIDRGPEGPSAEARAAGRAIIMAEAEDEAGNRAAARLRTPEGYTLTADTALLIAGKVLAGQLTAGFQTPSRVYGPDLVLEAEGVTREMVNL